MTLYREPAARAPAPVEVACADWLALRAEADTRARDEGSADLLRALVDRLGRSGDEVRVVDLGAGTGANHRYLAPRLPLGQRWTAVDHDASLLAGLAHEGADRVVADVAELGDILAGLSGEGPVLVTCSALLDVLTAHQLERLADALVAARCPALLALTVTGRVAWSPREPEDDVVAAAFDAHQQREGRPGPDAADRLVEHLGGAGVAEDVDGDGGAGVHVVAAPTPWQLDDRDAGLLRRWLDERVDAVLEQDPSLASVVEPWHARRLAQLEAGVLRVVVDHVDLLILPGSAPAS